MGMAIVAARRRRPRRERAGGSGVVAVIAVVAGLAERGELPFIAGSAVIAEAR
jgi:hypothetical protein